MSLLNPAASILLALLLPAGASAAHRSARAVQAEALWHRGEPERAAREFEAAFREAPKDRLSALDAAVSWRSDDEHARARRMFESALELGPDDADARAALGWACARSGDPKAARRAFAKALALERDQAQALLGLAHLELESKRPGPAAAAAKRLLAARPAHTVAWVLLARAQEQMGKASLAAEAWQKALDSDPTFVEARLELGRLYGEQGRVNEAWKQFMKALSSDSRNPRARAAAAELRGKISREPSEIIPPRVLKTFAKVQAARPGRVPTLRVAIGTTASGQPAPKHQVAFLCDGPFEVYDPADGKHVTDGPAGEAWTVRPAAGGGYEFVDAKEARRARFSKTLGIRPKDPAGHSLMLQRLDIAAGTAWAVQGDRQVKGAVEFRAAGRRGLYLVSLVGLEDYAYGVVNEEMPEKFHEEALKAQAVIARNHALIVKDLWRPHRKHGYDLCDGQHCQVFGGVAAETAKGRKAVDETRGLVLMYKGRLAQTPYSSNCGGHTQDSGETGGWFEAPYLKGVKDVEGGKFDRMSPWETELWLKRSPPAYCNLPAYIHPSHFRWSRVVGAADLSERLRRRSRAFGELKRVRILRRSVSGNVNKVLFEGTKGRVVLDREAPIRGIFSLASVRNTMMLVETERDAKGRPTELLLYGGGWGHNVGLCQYGALGRALAGHAFPRILEHYFSGTALQNLGY
ncbi:MAG: SpoIID/LytB domain-containing protein [Elusimicrobia bacterium]|nr:SpoIID/LytB domain-containing protein [Elusimicrobiota bacterium]